MHTVLANFIGTGRRKVQSAAPWPASAFGIAVGFELGGTDPMQIHLQNPLGVGKTILVVLHYVSFPQSKRQCASIVIVRSRIVGDGEIGTHRRGVNSRSIPLSEILHFCLLTIRSQPVRNLLHHYRWHRIY